MHRRRFLTLVTLCVLGPQVVTARQFEVEETPPPDQAAPAWDAIRYQSTDYEAEIRTIEVRVSTWQNPAIAGAVAGSLTANAHTPLPLGEFYHSEVTDWFPSLEIEDGDGGEVTGREWSTVVGVAAFTTCWAQIVAWRDRRVTVVLVSGGSARRVRATATRIADLVLYREPVPCGPAPDPLPTIDEVPAGMELVWRADQDGPWSPGEPEDRSPRLAECTLVDEPG